MHENDIPKNIGGLLAKFQSFLPTDRKVRNTLQSFLENRLELKELLQKDSIRCTGKIIYIQTNPYLKQALITHESEILALLRDKDHLYFDHLK